MSGVSVLRIPLDYEIHPHASTELNQGRAHVDIPILIDPNLDRRGCYRSGNEPDGPAVVLREWNEQVLLHELLHVILGCPEATEHDPHGHRTINRIEVALWETGWRFRP